MFCRWYINYDSIAVTSTVNRDYALPPIGASQAYQIIWLQTAYSAQNSSLREIATTRLERCQLGIDLDNYSQGDMSMICDCRDDNHQSVYRFTRSGNWWQTLWRVEPFRKSRLVQRSRVFKSASDLVRLTHLFELEIVDITERQAIMLDTTGVWVVE